jgi:oxygen-independent coproporphyrinogen-3 oxidase
MSRGIDWSGVTDELVQKYGGQAPRYTSYPTAVEWNGEFSASEYEAALVAADQSPDEPLSIYVHIPFCKKRCLFCGCASDVCTDTAAYDEYLVALQSEIAAVEKRLLRRRGVAQLHLGGGTPTVLDPDRLAKLISMLKDTFHFANGAELALEAAPGVTDTDQIETLGRLGFNRISFGVQDFTKEVQVAVDRVQSEEHTALLVETARTLGFAVNIDLMYGLPKQRIATWRETLKQVIALRPNRLAVFGYAHVPWMRPNQQRIVEADLPDAALRSALFREAHDLLLSAGYEYIGMDHFALKDDTLSLALREKRLSRNFQGYTVKQAAQLVGLGATSISDLGVAFAQNASKTSDYLARAATSGLATFRGMNTSNEDRLRRHVITEIMCNLTLDLAEVERCFHIDFAKHFNSAEPALNALEEDGIIRLGQGRIDITAVGRLFVRHVGLAFDTYSKAGADRPMFSRTV